MLINKASLSVRHAVDLKDERSALRGVRICPDGVTYATDGHIMMMAHVETESPAEFPVVDGVRGEELPPLAEAFTLPVDAADSIVKALPKKARHPILLNALIDTARAAANGTVRIVTTNLKQSSTIEANKIEESFPDVSQIAPRAEPVAVVGIDLTYLEKFAAAARDLGCGRPIVKLEVFGEMDPVRVTAETVDGTATLIGMVMPVRF